jgi:hypothetical protein
MQTAYENKAPVALHGMLGDSTENIIETFACAKDTPFGSPVFVTSGNSVEPGNTEMTPGIAIHTHKEKDANGIALYKVGDAVPVLTFGHAWVKVSGAVKNREVVQVFNKTEYCSASSGIAGSADFVGRKAIFLNDAVANGFAMVEIR